MKTNLIRSAGAALIAAFAAGAMMPGEAVAKPFGKPPISKKLPSSYFKKKLTLKCQVIQIGQQRKARIINLLNHGLAAGTKIYWRGHGSSNVGGTFSKSRVFHVGQHVDLDVPPTITGCAAWIIVPLKL